MTNQVSHPPSDPTRNDNLRALFALVGFFLLLGLNFLAILGAFFVPAFMCDGGSNRWYCNVPVGIGLLLFTLPLIGYGFYFLSHVQRRYGLALTLMAISVLISILMFYGMAAS